MVAFSHAFRAAAGPQSAAVGLASGEIVTLNLLVPVPGEPDPVRFAVEIETPAPGVRVFRWKEG